MTRAARNDDAALSAFRAKRNEIDTMLARLAAFSDDHVKAAPEKIAWGRVGDLSACAELLKRITDTALPEGEFAA